MPAVAYAWLAVCQFSGTSTLRNAVLHYTPETNTGGQENTSMAGVSNKRRPLNLSRALRCKTDSCLCNGSDDPAAEEDEPIANVVGRM